MHFKGRNNVIYKGIKAKVKNDWASNGLNSVPYSVPKIIKKADAYINPKTGQHTTARQSLVFLQ